MNAPKIDMAFPLDWPTRRPRTPVPDRKRALWRSGNRDLTLTDGLRRLAEQVELVSTRSDIWRMMSMQLSTNIRFTASGARDQNYRRDPEDPAVAFYFALDGRDHVLSCDRWTTVQDNIAAIAAHIEALRGQERWGVADLAQAFAGHVALPSPTNTPAPEQWWQVLGVAQSADRATVDAAWRGLIADAHPDRTGSDAAAARLNAARDEGRKAAS